MDFILEHKWIFLIIAEVFFWVFMLSFLVLRYWYNLKKLSIAFFLLFIINDLWIATMGFFDYLKTGNFTSYQIVILVIIVYALTYGKTDFKRLDVFIQKKVAKWKGEPIPDLSGPVELYGKARALQEIKHFTIHLLIFGIVHLIMFFMFGLSSELAETNGLTNFFSEWFSGKQALVPFNNSQMNNFSRIWSIVLLIDGVTSLSYSLFPKNEKKTVSS
jgi:hypothetical protein